MSEPGRRRGPSNLQVIFFVIILSFVCALILAALSSSLKKPKEVAKEVDQSEQMMIAARVFTHAGYFQIRNDKGEYIPAKFQDGMLVPGKKTDVPKKAQVLDIYRHRFIPMFVDDKGDIKTAKEAGIDLSKYIAEHKKAGYYKLPEKLVYEILPNKKPSELKKAKPIGYVIPVNGYGLWDAIYGYMAIKTDGDTVIGISWYEQKETPGLGANIATQEWQKNFYGKKIFQEGPNGKTDFQNAPIGITVVKGTVAVVLGNSPKAKSAVDGMAGATLTGNGVTAAYHDVLEDYRPFFIKLHKEYEKSKKK